MIGRREFLTLSAASLLAARRTGARTQSSTQSPARPRPTAAQLAWQQDELALFIHFGINTFTDREWGDGTEDPAIFAPARLDTRQWARAARAAGFRAMILTAKHHDGFCLWPTRTTRHSIASSPWRSGSGDLVREFVDACRAENLKPGLYLSPWDRHEPSYGDSARYNDLYCEQLTELLTRYGAIHEVWFDGAPGENSPERKGQRYDWPRVWGLVRQLQPDAVIFSDAGPDVRWIGNERGVAGDTNWSTVDPAVVPVPGTPGRAALRMMQQGDPSGSVWRPGETDVSIRPGWFCHPAEDARVKTVDELVDIYFTSVGRNSKLLLNVPPTRDGLIHDVDASRLAGMRERLDAIFKTDLAPAGGATGSGRALGGRGREPGGRLREPGGRGREPGGPGREPGGPGLQTGPTPGVFELDLGRAVTVTVTDLREDIAQGQYVSRYALTGLDAETRTWRPLTSGTTVGYRKLDRIPAATITAVRLSVETIDDSAAHPLRIGLY